MAKKCLIVDDVAFNQELLAIVLEEQGFMTAVASNGAEAMDLCRETQFDCIFLDLEMPIMNGIEFLKQGNYAARNDKPVIFITTTKDGASDIDAAFKYGATEYLVKPHTMAVIKASLKKYNLLKAS